MKFFHTLKIVCVLAAIGMMGTQATAQKNKTTEMYIADPHSYARPADVVVTHLDLDLQLDFDKKIINASARWKIQNNTKAEQVFFDTRGLDVLAITLDEDEFPTDFSLGEEDKILGQSLKVAIKPTTKSVNIYYNTRPTAAALQWLTPQQTAGKKQPFLFTQSQAILARTWLPCQDSPGIRFTYIAQVKTPPALMAVMSASNPTQMSKHGHYSFKMSQPVPSYLMALAVGDIQFKAIGERTGVYAEPSVLEKAVNEFSDLEKMLLTAEKLYGPYRWERYDLIVLPPSFPFGGMENPRLTFATPTILAGDKSLTSLVAHELAHSWSGNLVTNATWDDFWLNEGFTVYFERRIMEEMYGKSYSDMLALLGFQDLQETIADLGKDNADTKLKLDLKGRDPDEGLTDIAYEKGSLLLRHIEEVMGRQQLDAFLTKYFNENAFKVMTTEQFLEYANKYLLNDEKSYKDKLQLEEWIYKPGLPENIPSIHSELFDTVDKKLNAWEKGTAAAKLEIKDWSTNEWLHFIRQLPAGMSTARMKDLDDAFGFTRSGNSEIQAAWFEHAIANHYKAAMPALENFLLTVGRRKFLKPLYKAMAKTPEGMKEAQRIYALARPNYHSVSTNTLDDILNWKK